MYNVGAYNHNIYNCTYFNNIECNKNACDITIEYITIYGLLVSFINICINNCINYINSIKIYKLNKILLLISLLYEKYLFYLLKYILYFTIKITYLISKISCVTTIKIEKLTKITNITYFINKETINNISLPCNRYLSQLKLTQYLQFILEYLKKAISFIINYMYLSIKQDVKDKINKYVKTTINFSKITKTELLIILLNQTIVYSVVIIRDILITILIIYLSIKIYNFISFVIYKLKRLEIKFRP